MKHYLVLDTETTGLEDPIGVVNIAWWEVDEEARVVDSGLSLHEMVDPEMEISPAASGVHGITSRDVEGCLKLWELDWPNEEIVLICHYIVFDRPLVEPYMNIVDELCTMRLARRLLPSAPDHTLATLSFYCDLPPEPRHRALGDVLSTINLLEYMVEGSGMAIPELIEYSKTPILFSKMPWGKHKGLLMNEIPHGYLKWLDGIDLDDDMRATVNKYLGEKI